MTLGGLKPRGTVMAPQEALEGDPVILRYLRSYIKKMIICRPLQTYSMGPLEIRSSFPHIHGAETYGFCFRWLTSSLAYIPDTAYFDKLADFYKAQVLIVSMLLLEKRPQVQHLSVDDVKHLISSLQPGTVYLTHFGMQTWQAGPEHLAERLSQATGINVIAPSDGMSFELPISLSASK
ncbi:MAG: MBL fold metallo-hydrolase, partial [Bacillota bacterium]